MKTQRLMQHILERGADRDRIPGQREDEESEDRTLQWVIDGVAFKIYSFHGWFSTFESYRLAREHFFASKFDRA